MRIFIRREKKVVVAVSLPLLRMVPFTFVCIYYCWLRQRKERTIVVHLLHSFCCECTRVCSSPLPPLLSSYFQQLCTV